MSGDEEEDYSNSGPAFAKKTEKSAVRQANKPEGGHGQETGRVFFADNTFWQPFYSSEKNTCAQTHAIAMDMGNHPVFILPLSHTDTEKKKRK